MHNPAGRVLDLQRTIGNQAVQRLSSSGLLDAGHSSNARAIQRGPENQEKGKEEDFDYYRDVASQIIPIAQERNTTFEQAAQAEALQQPDTPVQEFARRLQIRGYAKKIVKAYKVAVI